ncbi:P2X purinoceptor 4-like isoform X2 [Alosa sapidissima]|uniref:P2X purinoceptor 4-like isoform X2 n=1 Tax=Alosa sapidissima TaxID=34773 RepID=UPI001C094A13|nr:P2X purinoceptor 4-like isoform X2 [Alosa sapidissima]
MALDEVKKICVSIPRRFFEYSTPKILRIRSKKVGAINRTIQLIVLIYVIGYVCYWKKGYQDTDSILSSVTTKVRGIAVINTPDLGLRIWDVADYVIPPQIPSVASTCSSDKDCKVGIRGLRSNGMQTGKCVNLNRTVKTCEIFAWCPLERGDKPPNPPVLAGTEHFTVLVKNNIQFPKFNFIKRNVLPHVNSSYLEHCVFNRSTDPECPIFRLKDIIEEAEEDFQTMAIHGGVMAFQIRWDCDLDWADRWCVPQYKFRRIDKHRGGSVTTGYNFRYAKYHNKDQKTRTLIKGYGIRFDIMVFGQAGKFNIVPTLVNVGAGLGLLGLVTFLCDLIVLNCLTKGRHYRERKHSYDPNYEPISPHLEQDPNYEPISPHLEQDPNYEPISPHLEQDPL